MEEQFTRRWMITLRVLEVEDHEQDNQKPLQDLFYRREKSIQKENDIIRTVNLFFIAQIRRFVTGYLN